ncbi:hypothetical protein [Labilibaculum antarcticum]|uniref:DUF304 domain-containing protein n=1 Tax=Labilibaculum antarcticum TaxID=1717717 RepID=A0A1Y1CJT0_9BACT|nr:hypothetical protein [Labilibaculum antarcticum]BAX80637.1 hypothetical protein ALGA_2305 [Labilibaculum antarcticum]
MKIQYKKKRLKYYLYFGIAWMLLGVMTLLFNEQLRWNDYAYIVLGMLHIGTYIYESRNQYLSIEDGFICKNSLFKKRINLSAVTCIKSVSGNYVLKTAKREMKIDVGLIDELSLLELNKILSKLNLEPSKTIFF